MNQENVEQAVAYLRQNKERYAREALTEQMQKAGYSDEVIQSAADQVFSEAPIPPSLQTLTTQTSGRGQSFFDLRSRKVYRSAGEKVIDFLTGFIGIHIFGFVLNIFLSFLLGALSIFGLRLYSLYFITPLALVVFYVGGIIYLWRRRRYIAIGILSTLLLGILLIGFLIIMFSVFSRGF
ncbi:hypothetical protein IID24_03510 [Patescibacteria group bacterium]|nr:hypothetical protein [Patescibacteria group bacterium]